ncbi:hypothetical protein KY284_013591 [Solanum tuberosum]|nr:hypothetical protein KY284_013591 [Solanum tuberosum]
MQHNKSKKPNDLYCEHCHMRNHNTKYCYKLIGYPSDHKYGKKNPIDRNERKPQFGDEKQRFQSDRHERVGGNKRQQAHNAQCVPSFTHDQYNHIMRMLGTDSASQGAMANMAGPINWQGEGDW